MEMRLARVVTSDGEVLHVQNVVRGEIGTRWKERMAWRFRGSGVLKIQVRTDEGWVRLRDLRT